MSTCCCSHLLIEDCLLLVVAAGLHPVKIIQAILTFYVKHCAVLWLRLVPRHLLLLLLLLQGHPVLVVLNILRSCISKEQHICYFVGGWRLLHHFLVGCVIFLLNIAECAIFGLDDVRMAPMAKCVTCRMLRGSTTRILVLGRV